MVPVRRGTYYYYLRNVKKKTSLYQVSFIQYCTALLGKMFNLVQFLPHSDVIRCWVCLSHTCFNWIIFYCVTATWNITPQQCSRLHCFNAWQISVWIRPNTSLRMFGFTKCRSSKVDGFSINKDRQPIKSKPPFSNVNKASSWTRLDNWNANNWSKWSSSSTVSLFMYGPYARPVDFSNWSCKLLFVCAFPRLIVSLIWTITS